MEVTLGLQEFNSDVILTFPCSFFFFFLVLCVVCVCGALALVFLFFLLAPMAHNNSASFL